jgi:hypothetical protein
MVGKSIGRSVTSQASHTQQELCTDSFHDPNEGGKTSQPTSRLSTAITMPFSVHAKMFSLSISSELRSTIEYRTPDPSLVISSNNSSLQPKNRRALFSDDDELYVHVYKNHQRGSPGL